MYLGWVGLTGIWIGKIWCYYSVCDKYENVVVRNIPSGTAIIFRTKHGITCLSSS